MTLVLLTTHKIRVRDSCKRVTARGWVRMRRAHREFIGFELVIEMVPFVQPLVSKVLVRRDRELYYLIANFCRYACVT